MSGRPARLLVQADAAAYGAGVIECGNCGERFEPVRTRWLCPACKHKESCCEGEALPERG